MNCQECRDLFDDMLDRRIKEPLKRRMLNHLTNCPECGARLERRRKAHAALFRALNYFDGLEHLSGDFADRLVAECRRSKPWWQNIAMPKWALIAASLVAMAGFVFATAVVVNAVLAKDGEDGDNGEAMVGRVVPNAPDSQEGIDAFVVSETGGPSRVVSATDQLASTAKQLENENGEYEMRIKHKTATTLAAATLASTPMSVRAATTSCIVSGSTDRDASSEIGPVAINSELDTRPAPEVRLDGLNLRTDEPSGLIIQIY